MPPQLSGQLSGSSHRPSSIGEHSPEVQALEARDHYKDRQPRIGDLFAPPAWEHDPSSIGAKSACQALLDTNPASRPAYFTRGKTQLPGQRSGSSDRPSNIGDGSLEVQALEARDRRQVRKPCIDDLFASPAREHDPSRIGVRPACQRLLYTTAAARPALSIIAPPQQQRRRLTRGPTSGGPGSWPAAPTPHQ